MAMTPVPAISSLQCFPFQGMPAYPNSEQETKTLNISRSLLNKIAFLPFTLQIISKSLLRLALMMTKETSRLCT